MFYDVRCNECGYGFEIMQGMNDEHVEFECEMCLSKMTRHMNRDGFSVPMIQGDTVAGGFNYNYYDEGLGEHITSKSHRKDIMEKKGLTEYNPDPAMQKHRNEASYIRKRSKPRDPEARAAINREYKTALDTRREKNIRKSLDQSLGNLAE